MEERLDALLHRHRGIPGKQDQFAKSGVEVALRRDQGAGAGVHHSDHVGRLAEVGERLIVAVDGGIDHLSRSRDTEEQADQDEQAGGSFPHR